MKNKYIITYDLTVPGQNYAKLIEQIKSLDPYDWVKPCESVWIISTFLSTSQVLSQLTAIDATDRILVMSVSAPWSSDGLAQTTVEALRRKI